MPDRSDGRVTGPPVLAPAESGFEPATFAKLDADGNDKPAAPEIAG